MGDFNIKRFTTKKFTNDNVDFLRIIEHFSVFAVII